MLDPDKTTPKQAAIMAQSAARAAADLLLIGGSLLAGNTMNDCIKAIKSSCDLPLVIFPGSPMQLNSHADAVLLLSLISGRNAELLIGQHVVAAPVIHQMQLETIATGYMLIDGGAPTTVSYISGSAPIPANKSDIAACTALAGEMLGLKLIYLDAGSGAQRAVLPKMIARVRQYINCPLIVGGGIRSPQAARTACRAGADLIVVGTAFEENPSLLPEMVDAVHTSNIGV